MYLTYDLFMHAISLVAISTYFFRAATYDIATSCRSMMFLLV